MNSPPIYITGSKLVALVSDSGNEIGSADVFAAHRYPAQLHGASSVWLVRTHNNVEEVLFQQRSQFRPIGAQWWGNTVCGNIKPGESYKDCALRRLQDELAIDPATVALTPLYNFTYKTYGNETYGEYEFDQMFGARAILDFESDSKSNEYHQPNLFFRPNPNEVMATAWLPIEQLISWASKLDFPSATETLNQSWSELKKSTPPMTFSHNNKNSPQNYLIAPWIILMLKDQRLHDSLCRPS